MKTFNEIRSKFKEYTAVCDNRQRLIHKLVLQTREIHGNMAEIGVYKGGTSYLIASTDPTKTLYSCDTFTGLPAPSEVDTHNEGDFSDTSYEKVRELLSVLPNVEVIKGLFYNSNSHSKMDNQKFSFVHLDVDLFQPTLDCLSWFYDRLSPGAIMVVDDYRMPSCPGVILAVDQFMKDKPEKIVDSGFKNCYFIKE